MNAAEVRELDRLLRSHATVSSLAPVYRTMLVVSQFIDRNPAERHAKRGHIVQTAIRIGHNRGHFAVETTR